jgi:hypothetical protein
MSFFALSPRSINNVSKFAAEMAFLSLFLTGSEGRIQLENDFFRQGPWII